MAGKQNGKFLTAHTRSDAALGGRRTAQFIGKSRNHPITKSMPMGVIDRLEVIDIADDER
ncbi:hypothetical protein D3C81_2092740 [compost metagenome]